MLGTFVWALIAAAVLAIAAAIWKWGLKIWIKSENWTGTFKEDNHDYSEELSIKLWSGRIWGRSELSLDEGGKKHTVKYKIKGVLRDGMIAAYFEGINNPERGAFLLNHSFGRGTRSYSGKYLMCSNSTIRPVDYTWIPRQ